MPRCYVAVNGPLRLVGRSPVGMGALSDTAALGDRGAGAVDRGTSVPRLPTASHGTFPPCGGRVRATDGHASLALVSPYRGGQHGTRCESGPALSSRGGHSPTAGSHRPRTTLGAASPPMATVACMALVSPYRAGQHGTRCESGPALSSRGGHSPTAGSHRPRTAQIERVSGRHAAVHHEGKGDRTGAEVSEGVQERAMPEPQPPSHVTSWSELLTTAGSHPGLAQVKSSVRGDHC